MTQECLLYLPGIDGTGRLLFAQPGIQRRFHVSSLSYPQDCHHRYDDLFQQALEALEALGQATVLAESFGGSLGLRLALDRPTRVRRLVLINTFAWYPRRVFIHAAAAVSWLFPPRPASPIGQPVRSYFLFGAGVPSTVRDEWWKRTADVPMRVLGHRVRLVCSLDLRPAVSRIRVPTWILAAPNDRLVPAEAGRWLAAAIRGSRLWQPRVGHAALVHPDVDIEKWLRISDKLDGTVRTTRCSIDYNDPGPSENSGALTGPGGDCSTVSTGETTCNDSQRW